MSYEALKQAVYRANMGIPTAGLAALTWGNASQLDRAAGLMAVKPSGVPYEELEAADVVVLSLETGQVLDGELRPSSDTPTLLAVYRGLGSVGGIVHAHSSYATSWAQAGRAIPCFGTTHADHFSGPVPVARQLTAGEVEGDYERSVGEVIVERFDGAGLDPLAVPGVLVPGHGPFAFGADAEEALRNAVALEEVARMAFQTLVINAEADGLPEALLRRHFARKHGPDAYYGQPG
jgi:L-ribulose-5-phosphate 4-epimerase